MFLVGETGAIVLDHDVEVVAATSHGNRDVALLASFETMFDGIGDQFRQHQRQRRGVLRRHHAEFPYEVDADVLVAHGGQIDGHFQQTGDDLVVVDDLIGGLAQPLMHHGDGLHAALGFFELLLDLFGFGLAGLKAQQCRYRLKIVLHTMVDFGDGRVLGLQLLLTAAQFRDVAAQHDGTHTAIRVHEGQRTHGDRGFVGVQFGIDRGLAAQHQRKRLQHRVVLMQQLGADFAQILPLHGAERSEATEAAHGVGRGIAHDAVHRQHDEAIRDAGVVALVHHRIQIRELSARNHLVELLARPDAFGLVASVRLARGHIGLPDDQAERLAVMPHGSVYIADGGGSDIAQHRGPEHRFRRHRRIELGVHVFRHDIAHHILGSQAHHRGRTALFRDDVLALSVLQNQQ